MDLVLAKSEVHGYGVIANTPIKKGAVLEVPFFRIPVDARFPSGFVFDLDNDSRAILASPVLYLNTTKDIPNIEVLGRDSNDDVLTFKASRDIEAGEECFIHYANHGKPSCAACG